MCARDGHIYYVTLHFLESQNLQNHLVEATSPSNLTNLLLRSSNLLLWSGNLLFKRTCLQLSHE